jgi:serine/threonine protein kinase
MESEIWYILHSIANALCELRSAGYYHGDVQPCNILIDEAGNVKLLDVMCYDTKNHTGILRMIQSSSHLSPIAPELMDQYMRRMPHSNYSLEKADIFSLGITLLCICTVMDYRMTFYSFGDYKVRHDIISQEMTKISNNTKYSQALLQVLTSMLQPEPSKRFSLDQLKRFIEDNVEL